MRRLCDEPVPGVAACIHDGVVSIEDAIAEVVAAQIGPDVFYRVQLRAVWGQVEQGDVVRDAQLVVGLMPSCAVDDEDGMRARRHVGADFEQMQGAFAGGG